MQNGFKWHTGLLGCAKVYFQNAEGVSPSSMCAMNPDGHLAHLSLKNGDVPFLKNMVWMINALGGLGEPIARLEAGNDIWDDGICYYDTAVPLVFQKHLQTQSQIVGFTIPHGTADPLLAARGLE